MIGWLDCSAGISGDMLLGALVDAGVELSLLQAAVDGLGVEPVRLTATPVTRAGIGALKVDVEVVDVEVVDVEVVDVEVVDVEVVDVEVTRTWADVRGLLKRAELGDAVRVTALEVFARLAHAEAAVHRVAVEQVHFHEVGALDALADIVGCAAGFDALGLTGLTASPVTLGSGTARGAHGPLPVPVPAVLALLAGAPVQAGPVPREMTTPTGAALLSTFATAYGPLPPMVLRRTGSGAGGRDPAELSNVLRLVLGEPVGGRVAHAVLLETNVDDLDPRLWPGVLAALLTAGADDAWLTPILMKKGRPAHTLSALCSRDRVETVRRVVFRETSTLGLREQQVGKHALDRQESSVEVGGQPVRVKLGRLDGEVVNAMPEWDDVAAAARALGRPAEQVLLDAHAAARRLLSPTRAFP
ncbi:MAG: nickel pincer cofactor biosynthesis protein LarC [Mycobacteriales bacterium]